MGKIDIKKSIAIDFKEFWTRKISIKDYFKNLFRDTNKQVAVVLIQNVILFITAIIVVFMIPYVAGNQLLAEWVRAVLATFIILLPFLVMGSFDRIRDIVEAHYDGTNMIISSIILLIMAAAITYVMVNGDIKWVNVIVCIVAILGSLGYLAKVIIDAENRRKVKNESN